jgi:DnaJ-class molecular chaperone
LDDDPESVAKLNYYERLQVKRSSSVEEIRNAYHTAILKYHIDSQIGAPIGNFQKED